MATRKNGVKTARRSDGTFAEGNAGRPRGALNRATVAAQALLDGEAEAITRTCVERAMEGDSVALRLCMERLVPTRRDRRFELPDMPKVETASDAVAATGKIIQAVADGDLTLSEGQAFASMVDVQRRAIETEDLERRISQLETSAP